VANAIDYERMAADYARHRRLHPGVLQELIDRAEIDATSRVIEIGCGTGNYLIAIQEATDCQATGVDPSSAMLAEAMGRTAEIAWKLGQAEAISAPGASNDLLFSVDVIHHVTNRPAFFREAARVLTPGGRICTVTDSAEDIVRRRPLSSHFPETIDLELARYPSIETLEREMSAAGFHSIEISHVELTYGLTDISAYRDRAFSSLHLLSDEALDAGIARLEADLTRGPVAALSLYTLLWGVR